MILSVVAVRDRAAVVFGVPNFVASIGAAIRGFSDEINRVAEGNVFNKHPEDFDLFLLGTYDDSTGLFVSEVPSQIAVGKDLLISKQ